MSLWSDMAGRLLGRATLEVCVEVELKLRLRRSEKCNPLDGIGPQCGPLNRQRESVAEARAGEKIKLTAM
jgi:hypothetical protein